LTCAVACWTTRGMQRAGACHATPHYKQTVLHKQTHTHTHRCLNTQQQIHTTQRTPQKHPPSPSPSPPRRPSPPRAPSDPRTYHRISDSYRQQQQRNPQSSLARRPSRSSLVSHPTVARSLGAHTTQQHICGPRRAAVQGHADAGTSGCSKHHACVQAGSAVHAGWVPWGEWECRSAGVLGLIWVVSAGAGHQLQHTSYTGPCAA
jgi:hypothetical protein